MYAVFHNFRKMARNKIIFTHLDFLVTVKSGV